MPGEALSELNVFAFGKLPAHGDFVCRGLEPARRDAWDAWCSEGLAQAREALGDGFPAAHGAAPPWRFVFGPSRFGPGWRAGAFAPSVDRAGRAFVIVLGVESAGPLDPGGDGAALAEAMELQLYRAFEDAADIDGLYACAREAATATPRQAPLTAQGRFWTLGGVNHPPAELVADSPPADLIQRTITPKVRA